MKRGLLLFSVGVLSLLAVVQAQAAPFTLNFSEVISLGDPDATQLVGNEFAGFGINTLGAYLYRDSVNDPFGDGNYGLSVDFTDPTGNAAIIQFTAPTPTLGFDWAIYGSSNEDMYVIAFDSGLNFLDDRYYDGSVLSGSDSFGGLGSDIGYIGFLDGDAGVGNVAISTLTYERPAQPIPEPASFLLLGLGGLGAVAVRRRRRSS